MVTNKSLCNFTKPVLLYVNKQVSLQTVLAVLCKLGCKYGRFCVWTSQKWPYGLL